MRYIDTVYLHCTATNNPKQWGLEAVKELHTSPTTREFCWGDYPKPIYGKNWSDIGYHAIVNRDGNIELGRPIWRKGAGVKGHNETSLHIAMDGLDDFEPEQIMGVCEWIQERENELNKELIIKGHYESDQNKTCPNYNMESFRAVYDVYKNGLDQIPVIIPKIKRGYK